MQQQSNGNQRPANLRCPINHFNKCRPDCAWFSGQICALMMIGAEAYALVEVLGNGPGRLKPPEGEEAPCGTS